ncbi:MAG: EFR1 family ferrodoxin, partial [Deltaproteobacteria bacterium]
MYDKVTIYFMSGTGNSYRVATWMDQQARAAGAQSQVIPIENAHPAKEVPDGDNNLMGIVMPTHGFTAPWHMIRFVRRLPRRKDTHAFCLNTQAGMKLGPLFIPGLGGTAPLIIALILALKGFRVRGVMGLNMPSNWMALHSGLHPKNVAAIIARAKPNVDRFLECIFKGGRHWFTGNNITTFILGLLLLPISALYLALGRFFLAKIFFASNRCNGCGICANNCPVGAINMRGDKKLRPYWRYNCENCMRCMAYCPEKAVEAGHSWAVILGYLTGLPVSVYFFKWLVNISPATAAIDKVWLHELLQFLYIYPALFLLYYIFSALIRIPAINTLFTYTTLTHIYRRYQEPDSKLKDFAVPRKEH